MSRSKRALSEIPFFQNIFKISKLDVILIYREILFNALSSAIILLFWLNLLNITNNHNLKTIVL